MIFTLLLIYLLLEIPNFLVYGWFTFKTFDLSEYMLNIYDNEILSHGRKPFISYNFGFSFFSKYYIDGKGRVLRFTALHKAIDKRFKELKNGNLENYTRL